MKKIIAALLILAVGSVVWAQQAGEFGAGVMLGSPIGGIDYWVANHPIEIFLEAGPVFRLAPDGGIGADVGLGARFYFNAVTASAK